MALESLTSSSEITEESKSRSKIIGLSEASHVLGVHPNTIYKLIHDKAIPAFRYTKGGRWKFRREELQQWVEDQEAIGKL